MNEEGKASGNGIGNTNLPIGDPKKAARESGVPGNPSPVWHREYWDRFLRNEHHFQQVVEYILLFLPCLRVAASELETQAK